MIVAVVSCLLGATTGFGYLQLRFVGVTGSPTETVQRYLQAISQNDALRALQEVADEPTGASMLTDEVLRSAHLDNPMSGIEVTDTNSPRVPVRFKLGDTEVKTVITVKAQGGVFRIDDGFATADLTNARKLDVGIQLGGREVTEDLVTVFPGIYPITTSDTRLQLAPGGSVKAAEVSTSSELAPQQVELTDSGKTALSAAAQTQFSECAKLKVAADPDCPFSVESTTSFKTITWTILSPPTVEVKKVTSGKAGVQVDGRVRFTGVTSQGKTVTEEMSVAKAGSVNLTAQDWHISWD